MWSPDLLIPLSAQIHFPDQLWNLDTIQQMQFLPPFIITSDNSGMVRIYDWPLNPLPEQSIIVKSTFNSLFSETSRGIHQACPSRQFIYESNQPSYSNAIAASSHYIGIAASSYAAYLLHMDTGEIIRKFSSIKPLRQCAVSDAYFIYTDGQGWINVFDLAQERLIQLENLNYAHIWKYDFLTPTTIVGQQDTHIIVISLPTCKILQKIPISSNPIALECPFPPISSYPPLISQKLIHEIIHPLFVVHPPYVAALISPFTVQIWNLENPNQDLLLPIPPYSIKINDLCLNSEYIALSDIKGHIFIWNHRIPTYIGQFKSISTNQGKLLLINHFLLHSADYLEIWDISH